MLERAVGGMSEEKNRVAQRTFRTDESFIAERVTRNMVQGFLEECGLREVEDLRRNWGRNQSQEIRATMPTGERVSMRVRLCWRKRGRRTGPTVREYSAAQLLAKIDDGDWEGSIQRKLDRESEQGITHFLLLQREVASITMAAAIPISAVLPVWRAQREESDRLIAADALGNQHKNHVTNGASPTLYLHDNRAWSVAERLWSYPGVVDLRALGAGPDSGRGSASSHCTRPSGGGYADADRSREVEVAAVGLVRSRLQSDGWTVESVEVERRGFDLLCWRGDEEKHVEVKGTSGPEERFILTHGELRRARTDSDFVWAVVTRALTTEPTLTFYDGPDIDTAFSVSPTQYRAELL